MALKLSSWFCKLLSCKIPGIYVGEGFVIYFTRGADQEIGTRTVLDRLLFSTTPSYASDSPCPRCGDQTRTGVIYSCLDCFLSGSNLYLFEYGVKPAFFLAKSRGGTCTLASSDPAKDVLHHALFLLEYGFGSYNVFKNNCEDFAVYCKTVLLSVAWSGQAASYVAAANVVVSTPLRFMTNFSGLALVGYGMYSASMYCASRLAYDIGVRHDVSKVLMERLIASPGLDEPEKIVEMANKD